MMLSPGNKLGSYEIVALLGEGGMGEVYRARDVRLRRSVAIKILPGEFSAGCERLCPRTLRLAVERGEIEAEHPLDDGPWIFNRRAIETEAAAQFLARFRGSNRNPAILTSKQSTLGFSNT